MISFRDIEDALENIRPFVHKTPLIYSHSLSRMTGARIYLKCENLQKTGSFKVRGAFNKMRSLGERKVIAASMGNHAQGVAFAAARLGISAKIVMPLTASIVKEEAAKGYGAEVLLYGETFRDALEFALSQKDFTFIHAFDDDEIIAGQGTIGMEVAEDVGEADAVLAPVGGGGLIAGLSVAIKSLMPSAEVIGVQTESALSAFDSFREKRVVSRQPSSTLADGIAVGRIGEKAFDLISRYVDDILKVEEDSIAMAILLFLERKKLVVEGAGAVPLAALIENRERFRDKRVVLIVSGGNIDFTIIDRIIHKGLLASGRIGVFEVTVDDVPGSLHALTGIVASQRGNILDVVHERFAADLPVGKTRVVFTIETRGGKHLDGILSDVAAKGFDVRKKT